MHSMYLQYLASTHSIHMWKWQACKKSYLRKFWNILGLAWWGIWTERRPPKRHHTIDPYPFLLKFRRVSYGSTNLVKCQLRLELNFIFFILQVCFVLSLDIQNITTFSMGDPAFICEYDWPCFECQFKWGITFKLKQMIYS